MFSESILANKQHINKNATKEQIGTIRFGVRQTGCNVFKRFNHDKTFELLYEKNKIRSMSAALGNKSQLKVKNHMYCKLW